MRYDTKPRSRVLGNGKFRPSLRAALRKTKRMKTSKFWSARVSKAKLKKKRFCNLCTQVFVPCSAFERYCSDCKKNSELFKFADWLPELDSELMAKVSV